MRPQKLSEAFCDICRQLFIYFNECLVGIESGQYDVFGWLIMLSDNHIIDLSLRLALSFT